MTVNNTCILKSEHAQAQLRPSNSVGLNSANVDRQFLYRALVPQVLCSTDCTGLLHAAFPEFNVSENLRSVVDAGNWDNGLGDLPAVTYQKFYGSTTSLVIDVYAALTKANNGFVDTYRYKDHPTNDLVPITFVNRGHDRWNRVITPYRFNPGARLNVSRISFPAQLITVSNINVIPAGARLIPTYVPRVLYRSKSILRPILWQSAPPRDNNQLSTAGKAFIAECQKLEEAPPLPVAT